MVVSRYKFCLIVVWGSLTWNKRVRLRHFGKALERISLYAYLKIGKCSSANICGEIDDYLRKAGSYSTKISLPKSSLKTRWSGKWVCLHQSFIPTNSKLENKSAISLDSDYSFSYQGRLTSRKLRKSVTGRMSHLPNLGQTEAQTRDLTWHVSLSEPRISILTCGENKEEKKLPIKMKSWDHAITILWWPLPLPQSNSRGPELCRDPILAVVQREKIPHKDRTILERLVLSQSTPSVDFEQHIQQRSVQVSTHGELGGTLHLHWWRVSLCMFD